MKRSVMSPAAIAAMLTVLLSACDSEISRTHTEPVKSTEEISCTYHSPGFCMDCGISFSGKFDCAARLKPNCSHRGKQMAKIQRYEVTVLFESGKRESFEKVDVLREITECR